MSSAGKIVDTWIWLRPDNTKVAVQLRLAKVVRDDSCHHEAAIPFETLRTSFIVQLTDPKLEIEGTDCEALRHAVWAALDERYQIKWFPYYLVEVRPVSIHKGLGAGMEFGYQDVDKGICWDGRELLRERRRYDYDYTISPWPGQFQSKQGQVIACIPASKHNEKALNDFAKRVTEMQELLQDFLAPDKIEQTLLNIAGLRLLEHVSSEERT